MKFPRLPLLACICWAALLALPAGADTPKSYVFSAVPQFTAPQVFKEWKPLLNRLAAETGIAFTLKTHDTIPQFEAAFLKGEIDFAFMNPYHAVMAKRAQGYVPLVRDAKPLKGQLLVRKDGAQKLADLDGKALGFPAPNAFGAALHMRALLVEEHGLKIEPRWLKTHSNVYRHVISGDVAAGGSVRAAFDSEPAAVRDQLRVLFETPAAASHPLAAHPRVNEALRERIVAALLRLRETPEGQALLKSVRMPEVERADYARDYRPLEKLKLEKYVVAEHE
ncbi:MAG: phosphate/phosphite/phosphonate ABC transporter substrate-binding protein [Sulfurisoma sp.]|nr:phosphate/phosphite/phosphonate ABC transporter substrate-binding protein [Sulfurisoma sp.]